MPFLTVGSSATAMGPLADAYGLVKLGGSDYHARGTFEETDLGGVALPHLAVHEFLKIATPIWSSAVDRILAEFAKHTIGIRDISSANELRKGDTSVTYHEPRSTDQLHQACLTLSAWLSDEERKLVKLTACKLGLAHSLVNLEGREAVVVSR